MTQPAKNQPDKPIGIEMGHDSYFNCPVVKFGTGKVKSSLRAAVAKRIILAMRDNGVEAVQSALLNLIEQVDPGWSATNLPKPDIQPAAKPTAHIASGTSGLSPAEQDLWELATGEDDDEGDVDLASDDLGDLGSEDDPIPGDD
jgi:hypothetical protein